MNMKEFVQEFKEFISKGNVITMAVGIIIGSAFTAIVNSLVNDIITPLIGVILGGMDFSGMVLTVGKESLLIGSFINAIISFLLTALVLFMIVKTFNRIQREEEVAPKEPAPTPEEIQLLQEIRDLLKEKQS